MSVPSTVKGQYFDVAVSTDGSNTFQKLCGLTTRNFTQQLQTGSEYVRDCSDPSSVPYRVINTTGQQADIAGNGYYNRAQATLLRQIYGQSLPYRFIFGEDASDSVDSGYYQGNFVLSNWQTGAADGTIVSAQFTFESDGPYSFTPGADIIVLDPLTMAPRTVVHGSAYSGTVTGLTAASTLAATSSDGTTLTVTRTGNTATVGGTFTNAGQPTITLTETLTAAPNSPKTSTSVLNVT